MSALVILVDDLRSFADKRAAQVARSSGEGIALLRAAAGNRIDQLWLDHDLGGQDTIWPLIEELERAAASGHPVDVAAVYVHSANPAGAARMVQALRRWGYPADRVNREGLFDAR